MATRDDATAMLERLAARIGTLSVEQLRQQVIHECAQIRAEGRAPEDMPTSELRIKVVEELMAMETKVWKWPV
jgi:hypothetical protein